MVKPAGSQLTEKQWQADVVRIARFGGWVVFHVYEAKRVVAGWPDLQLLRPPEFVVVELKTEAGKLTEDQTAMLRRFDGCDIETYVWRPSDLAAVKLRLRPRHLTGPPTMDEGRSTQLALPIPPAPYEGGQQ